MTVLDLDVVREQFPAFAAGHGDAFFENAGGSLACRQTIEALNRYYTLTKVQPYAGYSESVDAGEAMDRARSRWGDALGVADDEIVFGPSTSANTYVLAAAIGATIGPSDEVIVTNQDHEANTGAIRRAAGRAGATITEWRTDPRSGVLDVDNLASLVGPRTRYVTVPHASNIIGHENDVARICSIAHGAGARTIVDGVAFAPHGIPDVGAIDADVYLFSLYKTYSVHQGLMVVRNGLLDELPNQGHFFNASDRRTRLNPAGPDHAQIASSAGVLDYVELIHRHHGGAMGDPLATACRSVATHWQHHEAMISSPLFAFIASRDDLRMLGPFPGSDQGHRCPTIALEPRGVEPSTLVHELTERGIKTSGGHFYAWRTLDGVDVDPERGVVRLSFVHYTSEEDVAGAITALADALGTSAYA